MALFRGVSKIIRGHYVPSYRLLSNGPVRIGCSSGFWGDTAVAAPQLVRHGNIDFLVSDYLSEITMSLLVAAMKKNPKFGYTPDFIQSMSMLLEQIKEKGIKVVTNAGGINVAACAEALKTIANEKGIDLNIATITGDDLIPNLDGVRELSPTDLGSGRPLPTNVLSMNAYLGAFPIARALDLNADVVITGRCVDSALVLGPLIHKYGWKQEEYDLLSSGSLAGHLVECGAQATGGIFTDWEQVEGWDNIGFPIVECKRDGTFLVTKPSGTGGQVSFGTVAEQLVYEIGDPKQYIMPDVVCNWSEVKVEETDSGVLVSGAKGSPPTPDYKVSTTYADGFRSTAVCSSIGPKADKKARKTADSIIKRVRSMYKEMGLEDFTDVNVQTVGAGSCYNGNVVTLPSSETIREVMMWLAVKHKDKRALELFAKEIAPAGTGMAPGFTMMVGGRPKVAPVLRLFSFLYPKERVKAEIRLNGEFAEEYICSTRGTSATSPEPQESQDFDKDDTKNVGGREYNLSELAFLRSGDKGDTANIGVVARHPSLLPYIKKALTRKVLEDYFYHKVEGTKPIIKRYDLPGVSGLNFVLPNSLGGGGIASLSVDPQGKAFAQVLADFKVALPSDMKLENLAK